MAENKKDSFTFSDKIKNSKPAVNPFAKKGASKIGNNGKPKQTLFERSRRDAPFFVAAAAALLMLPFLYKYSGNVNDDVIVPPGSEDSVFDPERFGFSPSAEDPNGQIVQLAGRDPLSLIKGWGEPEEKEDETPSYDRDGFDDTDYTPAPRRDTPSSYRQVAPVATRAAFQRPSTKIKELGGASLNLRGGGGTGSRFGGAQLKAAAKQRSASGPKQGTKPVSLTPLRAAGSPSRSYFGQGGAAQARASRDAMSKANASEALRDAMFAPVEQGRVGGLGDAFFASGGGPGKFDRNMDFKGIEPWWWDMMKQQEMEKWKYNYFLWRNNLVVPLIQALAQVLAKIGTNLTCCIVMGNSDCDADTFVGSNGSGSKPAECCGVNEERFRAQFPDISKQYPNDFKAACDAASKGDKGKKDCPSGWKAGHSYNTKMNGFQTRWKCLGGVVHGTGDTELKDRFLCTAIDKTHNFSMETSGEVSKFKNMYIAVVVKNYVPFVTKEGKSKDGKGYYLCTPTAFDFNKYSAAGTGKTEEGTKQEHGSNVVATRAHQTTNGGAGEETSKGLVRDSVNDSCVIYIAKGPTFSWDDFKSKTMQTLDHLGLTYPETTKDHKAGDPVPAEKAFNALQLFFIEGYAFKHKMAIGKSEMKATDKDGKERDVWGIPLGILPETFVTFEEAYVLRENDANRGADHNSTDYNRSEIYHRNLLPEGYTINHQPRGHGRNKAPTGARVHCMFASFRLAAEDIVEREDRSGLDIMANVTYNMAEHGEDARLITVYVEIPGVVEKVVANKIDAKDGIARYELPHNFDGKVLDVISIDESGEPQQKEIVAHWTAVYNDQQQEDERNYVVTGGNWTPRVQVVEKIVEVPVEVIREVEVPVEVPVEVIREVEVPVEVVREVEVPVYKDREIDKNRTRLAEDIYDVPLKFTERRAFPINQMSGDISTGDTVITMLIEDDDQAKLNTARANSIAAGTYVNKIVKAYNEYIQKTTPEGENPLYMVPAGQAPNVPQMLDALNIAKSLAKDDGRSDLLTVPTGVVCDMARGIAVVSVDRTPSDLRIRRKATKTGALDLATDMNNTFGSFAIYMGDGYLYPNEYVSGAEGSAGNGTLDASAIPDRRFDCTSYDHKKYICTPDYTWRNYLYKGEPQQVTKKQIAAATVEALDGIGKGKFDGTYPLANLRQQYAHSVDPLQWRKNYAKANVKVFGGTDTCQLSGDMDINMAMAYIRLVAQNGTSYKPQASNFKRGDDVGGTNNVHGGATVPSTQTQATSSNNRVRE